MSMVKLSFLEKKPIALCEIVCFVVRMPKRQTTHTVLICLFISCADDVLFAMPSQEASNSHKLYM